MPIEAWITAESWCHGVRLLHTRWQISHILWHMHTAQKPIWWLPVITSNRKNSDRVSVRSCVSVRISIDCGWWDSINTVIVKPTRTTASGSSLWKSFHPMRILASAQRSIGFRESVKRMRISHYRLCMCMKIIRGHSRLLRRLYVCSPLMFERYAYTSDAAVCTWAKFIYRIEKNQIAFLCDRACRLEFPSFGSYTLSWHI